MKIVNGVLPSSPEIREVVFAENQPEYLRMPAAVVDYGDGTVGVISRYKLSFRERLNVLFCGDLWVQLLTAGSPQPQLPSVYEPFTAESSLQEAEDRPRKKRLSPQQVVDSFRETFLKSYRKG